MELTCDAVVGKRHELILDSAALDTLDPGVRVHLIIRIEDVASEKRSRLNAVGILKETAKISDLGFGEHVITRDDAYPVEDENA